MFGLFGKKTDDDIWLATARKQSNSIQTVSDVLARCSVAVAQDVINGWLLEEQLMSSLEIYRFQYKAIESEFKQIGSPMSSNELNQIKDNMDSFFNFCSLAFYWGKNHYSDASGEPGVRANFETGLPQRAAVLRVTNNGKKFCDNAVKAVGIAGVALTRLGQP